MEAVLNNTVSVLGEYDVVPTSVNFGVLVVSLIMLLRVLIKWFELMEL